MWSKSPRLPSSLADIVRQIWLPVAVIAAWWYFSKDSTEFFFPPLTDIVEILVRDLLNGVLVRHSLISLSNMAAGLALSIILGISFGLIIGQAEGLREVVSPTLNFLRAVPPAAIVPIIILAFGIGSTPKVFLITLGCLWPVLLNAIDGVRGTAPSIRETARAYRIPMHLVLLRVALPAAMPQIMAGIRVALAVSLVLMVISEFFGASAGIGFYVIEASNRFAIRETWAGTMLVGIIGYVLSSFFLLVERRVLAWHFQETGVSAKRQAVAPL